MNWGFAAGLFIAVFIATFVATKVVLAALRRQSLLDLPNERSSHTVPTPRGGGLAILLAALPAIVLLAALGFITTEQALIMGGLLLLLGGLSWIDDLRGLSPLLRFGAHMFSAGLALSLGLVDGLVFGGLLPPFLDVMVAAIFWVWFINLFNFMDGIDGIAGVEAFSISIGIALLAMIAGAPQVDPGLGYFGIVIAAASLGFLVWNWHPAKLFLGDVGSVPLGFILGWMLLSLAAEGYGAAALILPFYFLFDASVTLFRRLLRGERIWEAHREHLYQKAVQGGKTHSEVSRAIFVLNGFLIAFALTTTEGHTWAPLVASFLTLMVLVDYLRRPKRPAPPDGGPDGDPSEGKG